MILAAAILSCLPGVADPTLVREFLQHPEPIELAVIAYLESGWDVNTRPSPKAAYGLMQVTAIAAKQVGAEDWKQGMNLAVGAAYWQYARSATSTKTEAAIVYNGGFRQLSLWPNSARETRNYVKKFESLTDCARRALDRLRREANTGGLGEPVPDQANWSRTPLPMDCIRRGTNDRTDCRGHDPSSGFLPDDQ